MTRHSYASAVALLLGLAACGGGDLVVPSEGEPSDVTLVQGDGQSGRVGEALPQPLVFEVTDIAGRPVPGATVVVKLDGAALDPDTSMTDGQGLATVGVTLGGSVGTMPGSARVLTPADQAPVEVGFSVSAIPSSANGLEIVSGADQTAPAGTELPAPLVVAVTDAFGNPIEGVVITWTPEGGGSLSAATSTTDASGLASVTRTLGGASGLQRTIASSDGLAGSPAVFLHTVTAGNASGVLVAGGNDQRGTPGERLPQDLVVRVTDAEGNPVGGAAVTWVVTAGGGRLEPSTSLTDADGRAVTGWVLGPQVGVNTAQAVVSGVGSATFSATAVAGSANRLEIVSGNDQTAPAGQRLPASLVVRVLDASSNPVPGATVSWQVRSGGGTVAPATGTTDAGGQASAGWTLGSAAGAHTLEASVAGAGTVTFQATATVGAASALALVTQPSGSARVGVALERQPVVQLRDAAGNDVAQSGVAVTAAIASGPGSLGGTTTRTTDGQGRATFTDLEIGGAVGTHTLIFAATSFTSTTSSEIDVQRAGTTTTITSADPDPSAPGAGVTVQFTVTSAGGTPTGTVRVTTSAGADTCSADASAGSCVLTLTSPGDQTLTARYEGTALFEASEDTEAHRVEAPNSNPAAIADAYAVSPGATLEVPAPGVLANDSDPDGDPLVASVASNPSSGTLTLSPDGSFQYTPAAGFVGTDSFTYQVSDGRGGQASATVTLTVQ